MTNARAPTPPGQIIFALAFGTMVGVGWLVLMDDWLGRGGPLGAILGFALGGILLLPVGYVYGSGYSVFLMRREKQPITAQVFSAACKLLHRLDDAARIFHRLPVGSGGGRQACGVHLSIAEFGFELYRVAGQPVFLPRLALASGLRFFSPC